MGTVSWGSANKISPRSQGQSGEVGLQASLELYLREEITEPLS